MDCHASNLSRTELIENHTHTHTHARTHACPSGVLQDPVVTLFVLEHRCSLFDGAEGPDDVWPKNNGCSGGGGSGAAWGRRGGGRRGGSGRGNSGVGLGLGRGSGGRGMGDAEEGGGGGGGDVRSLMQAAMRTARRLRVPWLDRDEIMEVGDVAGCGQILGLGSWMCDNIMEVGSVAGCGQDLGIGIMDV
eukprot:1161839-Pelagomonas_calceolata.AAC.3